ncbi:MAG: dihydropyrimidinase [Clostridiales bacterium]|nr:dihydropyrimidinase [Clostridiales bacterium]
MKEFDLIVKNGLIATESDEYYADIGISDGKIVQIGTDLNNAADVIDAAGMLVIPGGIDIHTHIDAPLHGTHTLDDWYQGTVSAAFGGVTCVVDYPMQEIGHSLRDIVNKWSDKARDKAIIDYSFSPVITERTEDVYKEIPQLIKEGFPSFKIFMAYSYRAHDEEIIRLLDLISSNGGILGIHCENDWAIGYLASKLVKEGKVETKYHPVSRPPVAEADATSRVIRLAEMVDAQVLIVHLSCEEALQEAAKAREKGSKVYVETCTHFLKLDKELYDQPVEEAAKYVITPPLREHKDREALWNGLKTGAISIVSSDHCAYPMSEKLRLGKGDFTKMPHGAPGIETRLPVVFSEGVSKGRISLQRFVSAVSTNPARLAGLYPRKGTLAVGSDADITIIDPNKKVRLATETMHSNCDFSPFEGYITDGYPVITIAGGRVIVKDGNLNAKPGAGKLVKRDLFKPF